MQANIIKKQRLMALEIRSTPILTGETAAKFNLEADYNGENGQPIKFAKDYVSDVEEMLIRSKQFLKEHDGKIKFD